MELDGIPITQDGFTDVETVECNLVNGTVLFTEQYKDGDGGFLAISGQIRGIELTQHQALSTPEDCTLTASDAEPYRQVGQFAACLTCDNATIVDLSGTVL